MVIIYLLLATIFVAGQTNVVAIDLQEQESAAECDLQACEQEQLITREARDFDKLVKTKTLYTIEDIFVQDKESRLPAIDSQDRLLNGAFFKYANTSTDQV